MTAVVNWRRISRISGALLIAASVLALVPHARHAYEASRENAVSPLPATTDEFKEILTTVLVERGYEGSPSSPPASGEAARLEHQRALVLIDHTVSICEDSKTAPACMLDRSRELFFMRDVDYGRASLRLRWELVIANETENRIPEIRVASIRYVSRADVDSALAAPGWWESFYDKFPGTVGFSEITWPVVSEDRLLALIYVGHSCGGLCGNGALYVLRRGAKGWQIDSTTALWMS